MEKKDKICEWDGRYGKDNNKNLFFWCIHCGKRRPLGALDVAKCSDKDE